MTTIARLRKLHADAMHHKTHIAYLEREISVSEAEFLDAMKRSGPALLRIVEAAKITCDLIGPAREPHADIGGLRQLNAALAALEHGAEK